MADRTNKSEQNEPIQVLSEWCIYRVPSKLRNVKFDAFGPQLLSIGPFHCQNSKLKPLENHKRQYYEKFCERSLRSEDEIKKFIGPKKNDILHCYAGKIELPPKIDFVEVILIDACFIIELFLKNYEDENTKHYYLLSPWMRKAVEQDLILFENQIPYSLLEDLYTFSMSRSCCSYEVTVHHIHFREVTNKYFEEYSKRKPNDWEGKKPKHFTDLIRYFLLPTKRSDSKPLIKSKYDARQLKAAGVKFKPTNHDKIAPFEVMVDAHKGKLNLACCTNMELKLKPFWATYDAECVFRNVIALEQLMYTDEADICSYFLLMDQLVDTAEDVNLLVDSGVIVNLLGSSQTVANLINGLCEHILEEKSCYSIICEQLNTHYETNKWNRRMANIIQVYFKDLWTGSTSILGFVVLVFSIVTTVQSFL